jgi:hypothetical protein
MENRTELATVLTRPLLRRCWLLNKALEHASLDEALRLARAADAFLREDGHPQLGQPQAQASSTGALLNGWLIDGSSTAPEQDFDSAVAVALAPPVGDQGQALGRVSVTGHVTAAMDAFRSAQANDWLKDAACASATIESADVPAGSEPRTAMTGLAVLTGMDDIVRYLRQQDDVVVTAGKNAYLVNGRFKLSCEELLARANRIRERQGKPLFQRTPAGFPGPDHSKQPGVAGDRA